MEAGERGPVGDRGATGEAGPRWRPPGWTTAAVVTAVLASVGAAVNITTKVADVNTKLDRNCRILTTLDQDIRFIALGDAPRPKSPHDTSNLPEFAPFPDVSC